MAGRGSFQAIGADDVARLMALGGVERWDFAAGEDAAKFVARMDNTWVAIHCALSDGTLYDTLGELPLCNAVLGDHLVYEEPQFGDYVYLKHPQEVVDIARELDRLSPEQFAEKFEMAVLQADEDVAAMGLTFDAEDFEIVREFFGHMREFYRRAAARELAVLFHWG